LASEGGIVIGIEVSIEADKGCANRLPLEESNIVANSAQSSVQASGL
jgi:hypothetical protein